MSDPNQPPGQGDPYGQIPPPGGYPPGGPAAGGPNPYGAPAGAGGGYGAPPPPVPGGFGTPPFSAGAAIGYGWTKFTQNAGSMLLAGLIFIGVSLAISLVGEMISGALFGVESRINYSSGTISSVTDAGLTAGSYAASALSTFIGSLVTSLMMAGVLKGAFDVVDGGRFEIANLFAGWDKVQLLIAAVLTSLITTVGYLLCIVPGLVAALFLAFGTAFVVDGRRPGVQALSESFALVRNNFGSVLLWALLSVGVVILGVCACGVGLLVAMPVVILSQAYAYRWLQGLPIAA